MVNLIVYKKTRIDPKSVVVDELIMICAIQNRMIFYFLRV